MRAFISYSLNDTEQYVLSILAQQLQAEGFVVSSSYHLLSGAINYGLASQLSQSNLFIGLITASGNANHRVIAEWQQANVQNVPAILLVENTVQNFPGVPQSGTVVIFNRHNPLPSVNFIRQQISSSQTIPMVPPSPNKAAWFLGGLAAIALIGLLASKED